MKTYDNRRVRHPGPRSAIWSGLLLGFLLTLFLAAFVYVAYLFLAWGQTALAAIPQLPPLNLPALVRAAPSASGQQSGSLPGLFQPAAGRPQEAAPAVTGRVTVLVMGVDNRPDEKVARTDTIMVLTINPSTGAAGMLSLPRDLVAPVPGWNKSAKINTVHFWGEANKYPGGGPALLRATVAELIGYPIDYYVRLNFDGFRQIVDQIGGIDIDVPKEIRDDLFPDEAYGYDPLYIPAGRQHMNGALALKYARTRHVDDDYGRADRQQRVIIAIKNKVMQSGQLAALLPRLPGLAIALANSIQTDMPVERAITLARAAGQMNLQNPARLVIDRNMGTETTDPEWGFVLLPDMVRLRAAAAAVFADAPAGPSAAELARQRLQAEAARVVLLNGTREEGLAAKTATSLSAEGFTVSAVGNADRTNYTKSWLITYGNAKPLTREALIRRFGIPPDHIRSEAPSPDADLAVILGADTSQARATP